MSTEPIHILVADDTPEFSSRVEDTLVAQKYIVTVSPTVKHAIQQLRRCQLPRDDADYRDYAVAIIDMRFAGIEDAMNSDENDAGMDIFEEALKNRFLEPVIATAFPKLATAIFAANSGSFRYLAKEPGFHHRLLEIVSIAVETRRVLKRMDAKLVILRKTLGLLTESGADSGLVAEAQESLRTLSEGFASLLATRGKRPPGTALRGN